MASPPDAHSRRTVLPSLRDLKRKLTNLGILTTPDCKAADEIRAKIKIMESTEYNQMTNEKNKAGRNQQRKYSVSKKSANKSTFGSSLFEAKHETPGCPMMPFGVAKRSKSGNWPGESYIVGGSAPGWDSITYGSSLPPGSYIVGGSPPGWNFIIYGGKKPHYFG